MTPLTEFQNNQLNSGLCPVCGGNVFQHGPEGGLAENIRCKKCGEEYWFSPPCTGEFLDRRTPDVVVDRIYRGDFTINGGITRDL